MTTEAGRQPEQVAAARAEALLTARRFPEAMRELQPHVAGGSVRILVLAAQAQLKMQNYVEAQRLAEQAAAGFPGSVTAALVLAKVLAERRQPWRVHAVLSRAIALDPTDPRLHTQWALADLLANKVDEHTEDHARQAVSLQPANPAARQILSVVLYRRKNKAKYKEARELAEQAAAESPATALSGITVSLTARRRWNPLPPLRHEALSLRSNPSDVNARSVVVSSLIVMLSVGLLLQALGLFFALKVAYDGYRNTEVDDALVNSSAGALTGMAIGVLAAGVWLIVGLGRERWTVLRVGRRSPVVLTGAGLQIAVFACLYCAFTWDTNHARVWLLVGFCAALIGTVVCTTASYFRRRAAFAER